MGRERKRRRKGGGERGFCLGVSSISPALRLFHLVLVVVSQEEFCQEQRELERSMRRMNKVILYLVF